MKGYVTKHAVDCGHVQMLCTYIPGMRRIALLKPSQKFADHRKGEHALVIHKRGLKDRDNMVVETNTSYWIRGLVTTDWSIACCYHDNWKTLGQKMADTMLCWVTMVAPSYRQPHLPLATTHSTAACWHGNQLFTIVTLLAQLKKILNLYRKRGFIFYQNWKMDFIPWSKTWEK